jgi:protein-tyrosine-phosphatase
MAEALMKKLLLDRAEASNSTGQKNQISSAGIQAWPGQPASEQAIEVLNQIFGVEIGNHRSQRINPELIEKNDWIITMTSAQRDLVRKLFPEYETKIKTLGELAGSPDVDIDDPFGGSFASYKQTAAEIYSLLQTLIDKMKL